MVNGERGWRIKGGGGEGGGRLFGWNRVLTGALLSRGDLILIYSRVPNKLVFAVVTSLPPFPRHRVRIYTERIGAFASRRAYNATLSSFGSLGPTPAPVRTILDLCLFPLRLSCRAQTDRYTRKREREKKKMYVCVCVCVYACESLRSREAAPFVAPTTR